MTTPAIFIGDQKVAVLPHYVRMWNATERSEVSHYLNWVAMNRQPYGSIHAAIAEADARCVATAWAYRWKARQLLLDLLRQDAELKLDTKHWLARHLPREWGQYVGLARSFAHQDYDIAWLQALATNLVKFSSQIIYTET